MRNENMIHISFADVNRMFNDATNSPGQAFYMTDGLAFGHSVSGILRGVMEKPAPFYVEDGRLMLIKEGEGDATINLMNYKLSAGTLLYVGSGSIVQVTNASPTVQIQAVMFNDETANIALDGNMPMSYNGQERAFVLHIGDDEIGVLEKMMQTMWTVAHQQGCSKAVLMSLLAALMRYCDWLRQRDNNDAHRPQAREREIFEQFIALVNTNCRTQRQLAFYADRLCITERYLGTMVRLASGINAKDWIDKAVITAAKVMLCHSDKTVACIADELNFATDSFFCKYFHRITGTSPKAYRNEMVAK